MPRTETDLGLWAVCTATVFLIFGGATALEIWGGGWSDRAILGVIGTGLWSLVVGWALYVGLHEAGYRLTRPPAEQAEDCDDEGRK